MCWILWFPQILGFCVACLFRYMLDVYSFSLQILGFCVAYLLVMCSGCLWFPTKFDLVLRVVRYVLDVYMVSLQI
jgi:hypothetical protein